MVLCAIGRYLCFALEGGPPGFPRGFSCPAVLWILLISSVFAYQALTVFGPVSQQVQLTSKTKCSPQPQRSFLLWFGPLPRSLAATWGISFDFSSSGYLDVSVRRVPFSRSMTWMTVHNYSRIAPFGHPRFNGYLRLPAAFRSLSRPSSADIAKASTVCSYYLN